MTGREVIDSWIDETGLETDVVSYGSSVGVIQMNGSALYLEANDALRLYAALETWLAKDGRAWIEQQQKHAPCASSA